MKTVHPLPPRFKKPNPIVLTAWAVFIIFLLISIRDSEFSIVNLIQGLPDIGRFLSEAFPPKLDRFDNVWRAMLQTFQMALVGTFVGVIVSLPLSILASRRQNSNELLRGAARGLIAMFRTIPDLVWALIFVVSVGLGPFAGTLTLMIDTIGFCGRFFAEAMDEVDPRPQEALTAIGASKLSQIVCAVIPGAFPSFVNTIFYAWEKSTRSSVILGLVGAGGIGLELKVAMDMFQYNQASTIIICMFILVLGVERISQMIRKHII